MPHELPIDLATLEELAKVYGTPLQLYDENMIRRNARDLLTAFRTYFPGKGRPRICPAESSRVRFYTILCR